MKEQEYDKIFDELRKHLILVPQECILLRFRDVVRILTGFIEQENSDLIKCPMCLGEGQIPRSLTDLPKEDMDGAE